MLTLFESLDEKVFTPELKKSLSEKFDSAVEEKAKTQAIIMADELAESKIDALDEKAQQYGEYLLKESQSKIDEYKEELNEKITEYMDLVVQEFVSEARTALDESLKSEKADMLIEAFDSMLVASGVEFTTIMEAKNLNESSTSVDNSNRVDSLVEEVLKLKEENTQLMKMGLVAELSEGLTLVQAERFARLSKLVEFTNGKEYAAKLETVLESVKDRKDSDTQSTLTESSSAIWSHLV